MRAGRVAHEVSETEFSQTSESHRLELLNRGYSVERQLHLDDFLIRNRPWKTYWKAGHEVSGDVFVKVNYGYSPDINQIMGHKEAELPGYLASQFNECGLVRFPELVETWRSDTGVFVALAWEEIEKRSGFSILFDAQLGPRLGEVLKIWECIPQPEWWSDAYVLHDFALDGSHGGSPGGLSPFGFDLDDNLGVVEDGSLFIYDLEFLQWSRRDLQTVYLSQKYMTESRRVLMDVLQGRGLVSEMLHNVKHADLQTVEQAYYAHCEKLKRNGEDGLVRSLIGSLARRVIRYRVC